MAQNTTYYNLPNLSSDPLTFIHTDHKTNLLTEPVRVAEFSLDKNSQPILGRSKARYFYEPSIGKGRKTPIRGKLSDGYNHEIIKQREDDSLNFLTRWLSSMSLPNDVLKEKVYDSDFVACRGTLMRLMLSCYDNIPPHNVGMKLACCKFKGVYFIREYYTDTRIGREANMSERISRMCYEAHKFKTLVTTKGLGKKPDFKEIVNFKPYFIGVFTASINSPDSSKNNFRLFYGAEIDCIMPSTSQYLGLKTQYKMIGFGQGFTEKVLKWWIQAYLAGIKKLAVGIHENCRLNQVELIDLGVLTNNLSLAGVNVTCCFVFLYEFLHAVKKYLDMAPEGIILLSERLPNSTEFNFKLLEEGSPVALVHDVLDKEFKTHGWR